MENQYTLITGASDGIGEALAYRFAESGENVILVARNTKELERVKQAVEQKYGVTAYIYSADLSKAAEVVAVHSWTQEKKLTITCLVNNAGTTYRNKAGLNFYERVSPS